MDLTERRIAKIDRTAQQFTARVLSGTGLGLSEYELIHFMRHHPGISQAKIGAELSQDKAAVARRTATLVKKGYLRVEQDPEDGRSKKVYATEKAQAVKNSKNDVEAFYFEWLTEDVDPEKLPVFLEVLEQLYLKSRAERKAGYAGVLKREAERRD